MYNLANANEPVPPVMTRVLFLKDSVMFIELFFLSSFIRFVGGYETIQLMSWEVNHLPYKISISHYTDFP